MNKALSFVILYCSFVFSLPVKKKEERPNANLNYTLHATIKEVSKGDYLLIPQQWTAEAKSWNFTEERFHAKEFFKTLLEDKIENKKCFAFLTGIATGNFDDRTMSAEFGRFGLQHIMAISGFHFSMIAFFLSIFLRLFLHPKHAALSIVALLSFYFVFLGLSSSILRAWIASTLFFLGQFLGRSSSPLNSLGFALLAILLLDPMMTLNLGFQFSFLATGAILFFYSPTEKGLSKWLPKRTLEEVLQFSLFTQHAYFFVSILRQALALSIAVNLTTLPLSLLVFHKFPLLSFLYNIFFPFLVSISMLLLLIGLCTFWIKPISMLLFSLNNSFTGWMLNLLYYLPLNGDIWIRVRWITPEFLILYFSALLFLGMYLKTRQQEIRSSFAWI